MLSKTAQYALRALVYVARHDPTRPVTARDIAAATGVPLHYLSRILRQAVRAGLLTSGRGIGGGFTLARHARQMRLMDALLPFEELASRSACPFGQLRCNDANPCGFHEHWKPVADAFRTMLEQTTLDDVNIQGLDKRRPRGRR